MAPVSRGSTRGAHHGADVPSVPVTSCQAVAEVGLGHDEKIAKSLLHQVQMSDPFQLSRLDKQRTRRELKTLMEALIDKLPQLSDAIAARYLIHTAGAQALTGRLDTDS